VKRLLIVLIVFCASPVLADTRFDCDDLLGSWQGDRFDNAAQSQRKNTATFLDSSTVYLNFEYDDGNSKSYAFSYASWSCDGYVLTITHQPSEPGAKMFVDTFEIIDLNSSYFVFREFGLDCEGRYGDCGDITYETIRIPEIELDGHGC